jgi:uncharacterized damage-inducible protein DinB
MNISYFKDLMAYNIWANDKVVTWLKSLTEEQWSQPLVSSFPSIRDTALHILGAEYIWLQRLCDVNETVWIPAVFTGNNVELVDAWEKASHDLAFFLETFKIENLWDTVSFKRINGEEKELKNFEIFSHVVNHSSYHRGQLVTMLRQVGFTNVSSLDLMNFYFENRIEK